MVALLGAGQFRAPGPARARVSTPAARSRQPVPVGTVRPDSLSPLELMTLPPDGRARARHGSTLTASAPGQENPGDGTFWPDSSSPVRLAPSNATSGPAVPSLPSFAGWKLTKVDLTEGARQRYYLVARPATVTAASLPVLLVLPGRDMTPARIARASQFLRLVGQTVVVFPAGFANSWNAGYCCGVAHLAGVNDVAFLEKVISHVLATEPGTSARQVYITGFSNGGRMALDMACADPGAFAGVAAVEAVAVSSCLRTVPVPLMEIAYTRDPLLTVSAGGRPKHIAGHAEITVQALVQQWQALDGCAPAADTTSYGSMNLTVWSRCRAAGRVGEAVYVGGTHSWPHGGPGTPGAQNVIWDFFHHSVPPAPPDTGSPA
ncbi:MAG TPA: hypothetical protein VFN68_15065 [Acidimicrobiales bacterium]|nr:hypothetical protein [Acidimicrobiales bacterium]